MIRTLIIDNSLTHNPLILQAFTNLSTPVGCCELFQHMHRIILDNSVFPQIILWYSRFLIHYFFIMPKEAEFTLKEVAEVVLFIKDNMATPADVERVIDNRVAKIISGMVPGIINDLVPGIAHPTVNKAKLDLIDHIDRKTAEVRGDLVVISRKLDTKIDLLTDTLANKKVLTKREAVCVKRASPFPQVTTA